MSGNEKSETVSVEKGLAFDLMQAEVLRLRANGAGSNGHGVDYSGRIQRAKAVLAEFDGATRGARVLGLGTIRPYLERVLAALDGQP